MNKRAWLKQNAKTAPTRTYSGAAGNKPGNNKSTPTQTCIDLARPPPRPRSLYRSSIVNAIRVNLRPFKTKEQRDIVCNLVTEHLEGANITRELRSVLNSNLGYLDIGIPNAEDRKFILESKIMHEGLPIEILPTRTADSESIWVSFVGVPTAEDGNWVRQALRTGASYYGKVLEILEESPSKRLPNMHTNTVHMHIEPVSTARDFNKVIPRRIALKQGGEIILVEPELAANLCRRCLLIDCGGRQCTGRRPINMPEALKPRVWIPDPKATKEQLEEVEYKNAELWEKARETAVADDFVSFEKGAEAAPIFIQEKRSRAQEPAIDPCHQPEATEKTNPQQAKPKKTTRRDRTKSRAPRSRAPPTEQPSDQTQDTCQTSHQPNIETHTTECPMEIDSEAITTPAVTAQDKQNKDPTRPEDPDSHQTQDMTGKPADPPGNSHTPTTASTAPQASPTTNTNEPTPGEGQHV